jgi:chromosome partitioning protein
MKGVYHAMKICTILNEKGGVGKTTVAVTLAAGLAARGKRVLLVDAEEQGHATLSLGMSKYPGLYDLLVRDASFKEVLRPIAPAKYGGDGTTSRLFLLGSNVETRSIASLISDAFALRQRLSELDRGFDWCVIDTAPTPSLLHGAIYLATDYIVYPTECEFMSFDGLGESLKRLQATRKLHAHPIQVAGIVPNKVRASTLEHRDNLVTLRAQFGELVWPPIPLSTVWPEAAAYALPVFVHAPDHDAALAAWELVDRIEAVGRG